ncbi:MAG: hypothetical protein WA208_04625 [Thermoanaerobaculia bacterium]
MHQTAARPAGVVDFPLRHICVSGLPPATLAVIEQRLRHVRVSTEMSALPECDLLVIDRSAEGVRDIIRWVQAAVAEFPVILCTSTSDPLAMAEAIRTILFEDRSGWLRTQHAGGVRLEMLEAATMGLVVGRRSKCLLADARADARHLGAAFERHGLASAATLAAEAEQLLSTPFADTRRLATIVVALRNELSLRSVVHA